MKHAKFSFTPNTIYFKRDGTMYIQLTKPRLKQKDLTFKNYVGCTSFVFPSVIVYGDCIASTSTGIIIKDWQVFRNFETYLDFEQMYEDKIKEKRRTENEK